MYARNVSFRLKSNMQSDYTRTFENQILPLLRKQKGFKEEITLCNPGSRMQFQSVCGRTRTMQTTTTRTLTQKC